VEKEIANVFSTVILSVVHSLMLTTLWIFKTETEIVKWF
jgi:hypothetical protein